MTEKSENGNTSEPLGFIGRSLQRSVWEGNSHYVHIASIALCYVVNSSKVDNEERPE